VIEVIRMTPVVNVIRKVVNVDDRNQNHQMKKRLAVQNAVHHDPNQKTMIMVMIEDQKKVQHHHQDANVIMMMIMKIKVEMKVNDE
jgi:hypothetical protein